MGYKFWMYHYLSALSIQSQFVLSNPSNYLKSSITASSLRRVYLKCIGNSLSSWNECKPLQIVLKRVTTNSRLRLLPCLRTTFSCCLTNSINLSLTLSLKLIWFNEISYAWNLSFIHLSKITLSVEYRSWIAYVVLNTSFCKYSGLPSIWLFSWPCSHNDWGQSNFC